MKIDKPKLSQIPKLWGLWREAFGDTEEFLTAFYKSAFHVNRCRCVTIKEEIVASLYWFDCIYKDKKIAYLYAVATAKAYRGQGICKSLISDTHSYLSGHGYEGVVLVPGNRELFKFYEGMGYQTCSHMKEICCTAEGKGIEVRRVNQAEYARLRRQMLPEGGVVQEKENLDFLETQATCLAGDKFLLAFREENHNLYGIELLGDVSVAPKILSTLGYTKGIFRVPGEERPFAMYLSLGNPNLSAPEYFGLAFD